MSELETASPRPDPASPTRLADQILAQDARRQVELDDVRAKKMAEIAKYRWLIATQQHRTQTGAKLDFERWPFLIEPYQSDAQHMVLIGAAGCGKAQPLDALVHTPVGWKQMGEMQIGRRISTPDGGTAKVIGVFPQGTIPIFKITFSDGRSVEACGNHKWRTYARQHCRWQTQTTNEIARRLSSSKNKFFVPLPKPVEKPHREGLPIDPYILGLWLGDGELNGHNLRFATADAELHAAVTSNLGAHGFELHHYPSDAPYTYKVRKIGGGRGGIRTPRPFAVSLESLGLLGTNSYTKFIPRAYKEGSVAQRRAILQGLMDSDGYAAGSISFCSVSEQLARDVQGIVWSLGGIAAIHEKKTAYTHKGERRAGANAFNVNIRHPEPKTMFRLKRKVARITNDYQYAESLKLRIESIEPAGEKPAQCILIDHPEHLYITDGYVVTHNTDLAIVDAAARAACGLRVFYVYDNANKRNKEVLGRIDPTFHNVPFYAGMLAAAKKDRSAEVDSAGMKHFGEGSILFVGSESESEFSSHRADSATIEEHQLCNKDNLRKIFHRQTGSDYRFTFINGNPRVFGTKDNQNLQWLYEESDQRRWEVPCPSCWQYQELGWFSHMVHVQKHPETNAILGIDVRDQSWDPQGRKLEPRPICLNCQEPMARLSEHGRWRPRNPGHWRRGYHFSNLFNPTSNMSELLDYYRAGLHDPKASAEFVNDQLGLPYNFSGSNITVEMLEVASTGISAGITPYMLIPAGEINWRELVA